MPSHLLDKPTKGVYSCMTNLDILGNDQADKLAGRAAEKHMVDGMAASIHKDRINLVKRIQLRLATIITPLPHRPTPTQAPALPPKLNMRGRIDESLGSTSHTIVQQDSRITCTVCAHSFHRNDPSLEPWLRICCVPVHLHSERPTPIPIPAHKGNATAHHSHKLKSLHGLTYCSKCIFQRPTEEGRTTSGHG